MCCFSGPVAEVGRTNLFARTSTGNRQFLVYQMEVRVEAETAMILPLPVPPRSPEDAVRFLDFSTYPKFFDDLHRAFAGSATTATGGGGGVQPLPEPRLAVHRVGSYDASFVPSLAAFARLDRRFRLPLDVWRDLARYDDWGFAVFKLRPLPHVSTIEPMAMEFPRRGGGLFFPTVHIHDGAVHATAGFDHNLYFQEPGDEAVVAVGHHARRAAKSSWPAREFASALNARGILDEGELLQVVRFAGELPNQDARVIAPVADAEMDHLEGPMPLEAALRLVTRLAKARMPNGADDPAAARALVACLPWMLQGSSYGEGFGYAAPEWLKKQPTDERSEVYALAALLYELVSGRPLFGTYMEALVGHLMNPPPTLGLPIDAVLGRALAKEPEQRFATLRAFIDALS